MVERDYGHGAYGGLSGEASYGGLKGKASYGGLRGKASYGGLRSEAAYGALRSDAAFGGSPRGKSANRFGPYESYDSRSSLGGSDLYRSGHSYNEPEPSHFADSFDDCYESSYRNSLDSFGGRNQGGASWEASLARAKMRTGFMDERGRDCYSSYSGFASPPKKPAPAGSRGRGMPSFPEGALGSRSYEAFGGMPASRGRGMGFGGMQRLVTDDYQNKSGFGAPPGGPAGRGMKRKRMPPPPVEKNEDEEQLRLEAKRDKQRRKKEKRSEKFGYRVPFSCTYCNFQTFKGKDIEAHLASTSHQNMLEHIQKQTKFDKVIMEFLHEYMVHKFKKTTVRKPLYSELKAARRAEKYLMEGVTSDDHMMEINSVHCSACSVYVPAMRSSVQQHIRSSDHAMNKQAFTEQQKHQSVLIAISIMNNPVLTARYEKFAKGENPFEIIETPDKNTENAEGAAEAKENKANEQREQNKSEKEDEEDAEEQAEDLNKVQTGDGTDDLTAAEEN